MAVWTEAQKSAIETIDKTILVSAAAGSGKTTTLTERIIRKLTDEETGADISRFLIVTFTKAASSDMRGKISKALGEALAKDPGNRRLSMQMIKLSGADICTMDSFYYSAVKQNFELLGLPTGITVMEGSELSVMSEKIMGETIDFMYEERLSGFREFMDCFMDSRGRSTASEKLLKIYRTLGNYPEFLDYLTVNALKLREEKDIPYLMSRAGKIIKEKAEKFFLYAERVYTDALDSFLLDESAEKAYTPSFTYDKNHFAMTHDAISENDYESASELFRTYSKIPLGRIRSKDPIYAKFKELRSDITKEYEALREDFFSESTEEIKDVLGRTEDFCLMLHKILSEFHRRFSEEKLGRGACDFADIKRYAFKLFVNENGEPTETARLYSEKYDEIYIDEYQDTDIVQDMIFSAISREDNRFMVGDIKQSIYRFRGANPVVFASYKGTFPLLSESGENSCAAIYMSENFRCDKPVIDITNTVCRYLFKNSPNSVGYTDGDDLVFGKNVLPEGREMKKAKLSVIRSYSHQALAKMSEEDREKFSGSGTELERAYIISEIKKLLSDENETCEDRGTERRIEPRDIAVLLRTNSAVSAMSKLLSDAGIPCSARSDINYFENPEVLLTLSLLNVIDNPGGDVHLAAVLRSPLFGFGMGELIKIRQSGSDGPSLYDDVLYAAENSENREIREKISYFLKKLELYRTNSRLLGVDKLLRFIYSDTAMLSFAGGGISDGEDERSSEEIRANLLLLYDYARKFEEGTYKGLYSFISYINDLIEKGEVIEPPAISGSENLVTVTTIHKSKGLEFPVCFIGGIQRPIKRDSETVEFHYDGGIGVLFRDRGGFAGLENSLHRAVAERNFSDDLEEELRTLYVALTRARERLYLCGNASSENFLSDASLRAEYPMEHTVMSCRSYLAFIMTALMGASDKEKESVEIKTVEPYEIPETEKTICDAVSDDNVEEYEDSEQLYEVFKERFDFEYKYSHLGYLPAKMSVSRLYPEVLDGNEEDNKEEITLREKPSFLIPEKERATSAEKGTATHTFLQFCDFEVAKRDGVDAELSHLAEIGLMPREMSEIVIKDELQKFFESDFYDEIEACMGSGGRVYREMRFNILLDASDFTGSEELALKIEGEKILVQGVIDLILVSCDGKITLCDYKTDRLSNEELKDPRLALKKLSERHGTQLSYYSRAVEQIFGNAPCRVCIYSLPLGGALDIFDAR